MLTLLQGRAAFWLPRIHFSLLLLVFGELVAWQNAADYSPLDWLAVLAIYLGLGALLLDILVRYLASDWLSLMLVAGIFALIHGTLITLTAVQTDNLPQNLGLRTLGIMPLMFLLAYASFRLLSSGEATGLFAFLIAAVVGIGWGIWARWLPEVDHVAVTHITFEESFPFVIGGLVLVSLFPFVYRLPESMDVIDWLLTPFEGAMAGGVLIVAFILRSSDGYIDTIGSAIALSLLLMIGFMLVATRTTRRGIPLRKITPPKKPLLLGWLIILLPFTGLAWLGFNLTDGDEPVYASVFFGALLIFGLLWLPMISTWMGISVMTRLTREGL
jgi:hypothetical protein